MVIRHRLARALLFGATIMACVPTIAAETGQTRTLKLRFITIAVNEAFFNPVKKGVQDAARLMNAEAVFTGTPGVDTAQMQALTRQAIADGVDGIALNVYDPKAFREVIAEASAKQIPVVAFNIDAAKTASGNLSYVMQDFVGAGTALGLRAAETLKAGAKAIVTQHDAGISALEERQQGIERGLKPKGVTIIPVITGQDPAEAARKIEAAAAAAGGVDAILATGQADTEGGAMAAQTMPNRPFVGGFDLSPKILDLIEAGSVGLTIDQQPYTQGFYPVVQLVLKIRYGLMPSSLDAGSAIIDKTNVGTVKALITTGYR